MWIRVLAVEKLAVPSQASSSPFWTSSRSTKIRGVRLRPLPVLTVHVCEPSSHVWLRPLMIWRESWSHIPFLTLATCPSVQELEGFLIPCSSKTASEHHDDITSEVRQEILLLQFETLPLRSQYSPACDIYECFPTVSTRSQEQGKGRHQR